MSKKPVVAIPCNVIDYDGMPAHAIREGYATVLAEVVGAVPLLIPALGRNFNFNDVADIIDGILLTGAPAHVQPCRYGADQVFGDEELDLKRDATVFPIIEQALALDKPFIAICRGFQELNVAMGGTLHQRVHELPGKLDHRSNKKLPTTRERFEYRAHKVTAQKGGMFEKMGLTGDFAVNSLHQQGIDRLGKGLFVEAISEDGIIEAISVPGKKFALATQYHPEADYNFCKESVRIFEAYRDALHAAKDSCGMAKTACAVK